MPVNPDSSAPGGGGTSAGNAAITYDGQIHALFQNRCAYCHNANNGSIPNWLDYKVAYSFRELIYQKVVVDRSMPLPPYDQQMTDADRKLIGDWIQEGAPKDNGTPSGPGGGPTPGPTPNPVPSTSPSPIPTLSPIWNPSDGVPQIVYSKLCYACHGDDGNPVSQVFPRLAGQQASYLVSELKAFRNGTRHDPQALSYMAGEASMLKDSDINLIASYFSQQKPLAGDPTGTTQLREEGDQLFHQGDPAAGLVACATCHGQNGEGDIGPRLAGQGAGYLFGQYEAFIDGSREEATTMPGIVKNLNSDQMKAIASYLQSLATAGSK